MAAPCRSKVLSPLIRYPEHIGVFSGSRRCGGAIVMVSKQLGEVSGRGKVKAEVKIRLPAAESARAE
jgi:hypothetical protein